MIFSLAACGGTFDGNYKEVTGEEYNTVVADAQAAFEKGGIDGLLSPKTENSKTIRLAAANEAAASGAKAEAKVALESRELTVKKSNTTSRLPKRCASTTASSKWRQRAKRKFRAP